MAPPEERSTSFEFQPPSSEGPSNVVPEAREAESSHPAWIPQPSVADAEPAGEPEEIEEGEMPVVSEDAPLNINQATYEDLRRLRLSVTQTGRVLAYRDRVGGFKSLDELDRIPGFPKSFLTELKRGLII